MNGPALLETLSLVSMQQMLQRCYEDRQSLEIQAGAHLLLQNLQQMPCHPTSQRLLVIGRLATVSSWIQPTHIPRVVAQEVLVQQVPGRRKAQSTLDVGQGVLMRQRGVERAQVLLEFLQPGGVEGRVVPSQARLDLRHESTLQPGTALLLVAIRHGLAKPGLHEPGTCQGRQSADARTKPFGCAGLVVVAVSVMGTMGAERICGDLSGVVEGYGGLPGGLCGLRAPEPRLHQHNPLGRYCRDGVRLGAEGYDEQKEAHCHCFTKQM
mmetsp:Transcript_100253/g.139341  ORF Transcript_100253/g.139341 Transcript_100253/m.139341 type:complete len:267 (+) Transcript_100253:907-1707(+)